MPGTREEQEQRTLFIGARAAAVAGVVVGGVVIGAQFVVGSIYSGAEARQLVVAMSGPVSSLSTAIISGLATILALMLTLLSLSRKLEQELTQAFYTRVQRIALLSILDLVAGIAMLLILSSPIQKASEQAKQAGQLQVTITYYVLVGLTALLAGLFVAIIVMLYNAVQAVIQAVAPEH